MRVLRAPLVHFLGGGAALFVLVHGRGRSAEPPAPPPAVVVGADDVARMRADYRGESGLEPTPADEAALVDKAIDEELLFREAVARGLDRNDRSVRNWLVEEMKVLAEDATDDPDRLFARARALGLDRSDLVVRRIMVQKMRLLAARTDERTPTDAELAGYYAEHRDDYRAPDRVTLWQAFVSSSTRGAATVADAAALLARLRGAPDGPAAAARVGDPFAAPAHVVAQSPAQLARTFGPAFAATVARADTATWIGPVASPFGVHLVWIEAREPGASPPLEAVASRVRERWEDEQRAARLASLLRELRRRYPLRVESAAWRQAGRAS
jgi:hypothetical protein